MAKRFYTQLCVKYEGDGVRHAFIIEPDIPDAWFGEIGTHTWYLDEATALVEFRRDLTPGEEAILARRGGVRETVGKPVFTRAIRARDIADADAERTR